MLWIVFWVVVVAILVSGAFLAGYAFGFHDHAEEMREEYEKQRSDY